MVRARTSARRVRLALTLRGELTLRLVALFARVPQVAARSDDAAQQSWSAPRGACRGVLDAQQAPSTSFARASGAAPGRQGLITRSSAGFP